MINSNNHSWYSNTVKNGKENLQIAPPRVFNVVNKLTSGKGFFVVKKDNARQVFQLFPPIFGLHGWSLMPMFGIGQIDYRSPEMEPVNRANEIISRVHKVIKR